MLNKRPPPDMAEEYEDPRYLDTRQFLMLQRLLQIRLVCHSSADVPKFAPAFSRLQRSMNVVVWLFAWLMPENVTERLDDSLLLQMNGTHGPGKNHTSWNSSCSLARRRGKFGIERLAMVSQSLQAKNPWIFVAVISSQCFPLDSVAATCSVLAVWVWLSRQRSSNGRFFPD